MSTTATVNTSTEAMSQLQDFTVVCYDFNTVEGQAAKSMFQSYTNAACNSTSNGKYSDYNDATITQAFNQANKMYAVYVPSSLGISIPAGFSLIHTNLETKIASVLLLFTLPSGKGHMLVTRLIGHMKLALADGQITRIECHTQNFAWITGSCQAHHFVSENDDISNQPIHRTNILYFNYFPVQMLDAIPCIANADEKSILNEPCFEHAPHNGHHKIGPLCQSFLEMCRQENIVTEEEWSRSRLDVRSTILRPGQSGNPIGPHGDFIPTEPNTGFFCNPLPNQNLKIILVSTGSPGTRLYTEPFHVTITTSDWTTLWRDANFQKVIYGPDAKYLDTKNGCPVIMNEMNIHTAQLLEAKNLQDGKTACARLFIRLVIYPESRKSEVPTEAARSIPQVYCPVPVM